MKTSDANSGFTLMELLLVMAILAIIASVMVVVLRPQEYLRRADDSTRIQDMRLLDDGLQLYRASQSSLNLGSPSVVYVSIPDTSQTCDNLTLPDLPSGWSYACASESTYRNIDGTGWIPVDLSSTAGIPFSTLPVDPDNSVTNALYYTYVASSSDYVVASLLESDKRLQEQAFPDGGTDPGRFERGSDLLLWAQATGLVGWWPLDGDVTDHSGTGNNATNYGATATTSCKIDRCYSFSGAASNYIDVTPDASINNLDQLTYIAWINPSNVNNDFEIMAKYISRRELRIKSSGVLRGCYTRGSLTSVCSESVASVVSVDTWQHVVYVAETVVDRNVKLYINGSEPSYASQDSGDGTVAGDSAVALNIGRRSSGDRHFRGRIDDARVYSRALSAAEIEAMYKAQQ